MAKRRGHGEGSVFQRADGRWSAYISLEDHTRKYFYGKTQKEVIDKLQKAQREKHQGVLVTTPDQRLETYFMHWLEAYKTTVRVATYNQRHLTIKNHLIPQLGHILLQRLTPQHIRAFHAKELANGLKAQTVRCFHSTLRMILDQAVKDGLVARNVCDVVDPPRPVRAEMKALTQEQAFKLLETAKGHRMSALLTLAVTTGMRAGEILGLRWSDIDMGKGVLFIRRTIKRVGSFGIIENEPKTAKGKRKVVLPSFVIEALKAHRDQQQTIRDNSPKWYDNNLVFCNRFGGVIENARLHTDFKALLRSADLPLIRFHDLRHSAATLLLSMGIHPKVVQELLGHSTIAMTLDTYSHVLPSMHEEAMRKMDDLFKRG